MTEDVQSPGSLDPRRFRDVLGNFPTGVVVVTAMDARDQPVAMVVGSFTSVSLDPPLVAFLPTRTSSSYERLRESTTFCVNVLSEEQEELSRRLASRDPDKFGAVGWRRAPSGSPILDGAVAWIDCDLTARHVAGDHDIVIGTVTALDTEAPAGPLVFFQGKYGRFEKSPDPLALPAHLSRCLQIADESRQHLVQLAKQTGLEAYAQAIVGDDLVILVAVTASGESVRTHVGRHLPLRAPYGATFAAYSPELQERWSGVKRSHHADGEGAAALARVRERGWSIGLVAADHDDHWETISRHRKETGQAGVDERIVLALHSIAGSYEPPNAVLEGDDLDVRIMAAPVLSAQGRVLESIALFGFPSSAHGEQIQRWSRQLLATAEQIARELECD